MIKELVYILILCGMFNGCTSVEPKEKNLDIEFVKEIEQPKVEEGIEVGKKAVDIVFEDIYGNSIKLSNFRGKKVILNFFATWCKYCVLEMPDLEKIYSENKNKEFEMIALNDILTEKGGKEYVEGFFEDNGYTFDLYYDSEGKAKETYKVDGLPTTIIIDENGIILNRIKGLLKEEQLREMIGKVK